MRFKINSPFHMDNSQCAAMKVKRDKLKKEVDAMIAESKKTGKVVNSDAKQDELSRLSERIASKCK